MNYQELISSGLLESYVLGQTTAEENVLIQSLCQAHPEVLAEIEGVEESLIKYSELQTPVLQPGLKNKIAGTLQIKNSSSAEIKTLNNGNNTKLYQFGMAASILLFVTSLTYNVLLQNKVRNLEQGYEELIIEKTYVSDQFRKQQVNMIRLNEQVQIISDPAIKTIALAGQKTLKGNSALVHWKAKTNEVYFNAASLPAAADDKQYQLWAIVDGKPVDAGMITLEGKNIFQKMKSVEGAQAFAVTIEKRGGSAAPTMETLCLMGKV